MSICILAFVLKKLFFCRHNHQTRTIYIWSIYKYSLKCRALNNEGKIFSPLLRFYTRSSLVIPLTNLHEVTAQVPAIIRPELQFSPLDLFYFVPALLFSLSFNLFLPSSVSLSYFILAVPMHKCWENTGTALHFLQPLLNDTVLALFLK